MKKYSDKALSTWVILITFVVFGLPHHANATASYYAYIRAEFFVGPQERPHNTVFPDPTVIKDVEIDPGSPGSFGNSNVSVEYDVVSPPDAPSVGTWDYIKMEVDASGDAVETCNGSKVTSIAEIQQEIKLSTDDQATSLSGIEIEIVLDWGTYASPCVGDSLLDEGASGRLFVEVDGDRIMDDWVDCSYSDYLYEGINVSLPPCDDVGDCNASRTVMITVGIEGVAESAQECDAFVEAESGILTSPMSIVSDPEASNGEFIRSTLDGQGTASYSIDLGGTGNYEMIGNVFAASSAGDSFYLKIDDGEEINWHLNPSGNPLNFNEWREDEVNNEGAGSFDNPEFDPFIVKLTQGKHTMVIRGREENCRLDYLYLLKTNTACDDPDGDGVCYPEDNCFTISNPNQEDIDGDGIGDACDVCTDVDGDNYCAEDNDCDDSNPNVNPNTAEVCDGYDNDCDGLTDADDPGCTGLTDYYKDVDGDTYGDPGNILSACTQPTGYVLDNTDCDDGNAAIHPGVSEVCNGVDDNCDGVADEGCVCTTYYRDTDGDGYGTSDSQCLYNPTAPYVATVSGDCDDGDSNVNPGSTEACDGIDNNCNGQVDEGVTNTYYKDADGDTYGDPGNILSACTQPAGYVSDNTDCDDGNAAVHPGAAELDNGKDDNCNGQIDEKTTLNSAVCISGKMKTAEKFCKTYIGCQIKEAKNSSYDLDTSVVKAKNKFYSNWEKVESMASKKEFSCETGSKESFMSLVLAALEDIKEKISDEDIIKNPDSRGVIAALLKTAQKRCARLLKAETKNIKKPDSSKLDMAYSKANYEFEQNWEKVVSRAAGNNITINDNLADDIKNMLDDLVVDLIAFMK